MPGRSPAKISKAFGGTPQEGEITVRLHRLKELTGELILHLTDGISE
jgi:hypothetical protein